MRRRPGSRNRSTKRRIHPARWCTWSAGSHPLTLAATDERGATCADSVQVAVSTPPVVAFTEPQDGATARPDADVVLRATVSDDLDAPQTLTLAWSSSLGGALSATGADADGVATLATMLSRGDHTLTLTATDSTGLVGTASTTVHVNGAPTAPEVTIAPVAADTTDDLVASIATPSVDPEGDAVGYASAWDRDGTTTAHTTGTVPSADTARGQTWTVHVTPSDPHGAGATVTASVTIGDAPPSIIGATISPATPRSDQALTAAETGFSDPDGDASSPSFQWAKGGVPIPDAAGATLPITAFARWDRVKVTVTPGDGHGGVGPPKTSAEVVIRNTPPTATGVTVNPASPDPGDALVATLTGWTDPDGDASGAAAPRRPGSTPIRISAPWSGATTWASQPSIAASPFASSASVALAWLTIDVTSLYDDWQQGTYPNEGIELRPTLTANNRVAFDTSEAASAQPRLVVKR